jgi:hypothetical protein
MRIKSEERCDAEMDNGMRCGNRGEHLVTYESVISKQRRAILLCDLHVNHNGIRHDNAPYREPAAAEQRAEEPSK